MTFDDSTADQPSSGATLVCWYCDRAFGLDYVLRDGILRGRDDRYGGPFRLFLCPICNRANQCEKSRKGRWFSSPNFQPNLLDYLLGAVMTQPEDFLKAASWYRDNEERRRYFFQRDGDHRYNAGGWLRRLWPFPPRETGAGRSDQWRGTRAHDSRRSDHDQEPPPRRGQQGRPGSSPRPPPRILGPWDILGVNRSATPEEIRKAFHRLAVQYHPDKVHRLGEEFQRVAHEKFTELQNAYDELLRRAARDKD